MSKLQNNSVIEKCGECSLCMLNYLLVPQCLRLFKTCDIHTRHSDCPLPDCKVFNVSEQKTPSVDTLQWLLQNIYDSEGKPVDKIIVVRQKSSHGKE